MPFASDSFCSDNAFHVHFFGYATELAWQTALDETDVAGLVADAVRVDGNVESFEGDAAVSGHALKQIDAVQRLGLGLNGLQP